MYSVSMLSYCIVEHNINIVHIVITHSITVRFSHTESDKYKKMGRTRLTNTVTQLKHLNVKYRNQTICNSWGIF